MNRKVANADNISKTMGMLAIILFIISYFDDAIFLGFKFGVVWKAVVLAYFFYQILTNKKFKWSPIFVIGMVIAAKSLVYVYHSFGYFLVEITETIKFLTLPVAIEYFRTRSNAYNLAGRIQMFLVLFLMASCVPFILGLSPYDIKEFESLAIYGMDDINSFAGIFGNPHNAAVSIATACLIVIHMIRIGLLSRKLGGVLLGIGLASVYFTYARTGWLALLVGSATYLFVTQPIRKSILILLAAALLASIAVYIGFENSELFRMRMTGTNLYTQESSANQLGSGRFEFWTNALANPLSEGGWGLTIGIGMGHAKDLMEAAVGMRIFSHNGFLDAYQTSGLIGFFLIIIYYFSLWKFISKRNKSADKSLAKSLFVLFIFVQLVQGGTFIWLNLLLATAIVRAEWYSREINLSNKNANSDSHWLDRQVNFRRKLRPYLESVR